MTQPDFMGQIESVLKGADVQTSREEVEQELTGFLERYEHAMNAQMDTVREIARLIREKPATCSMRGGFLEFVKLTEQEALVLAFRMTLHRKAHEAEHAQE